jgi:hypothetical protein
MTRSGFQLRSCWITVAAISMCLTVGGPLGWAETVSMGQLVGVKGIVVPPVEKVEVTKLVDAGTVETDGFTTMVVNLGGEMATAR